MTRITDEKKLEFETLKNGCIICTSHKYAQVGRLPYLIYWDRETKTRKYYHRMIYEKAYGEIPKGMVIRHTCDNSKCCNLKHLVIGTPKDNTQDAIERNRFNAKGQNNPSAKLTDDDVKIIFTSKNIKTVSELCEMFNVSRTTITDIINKKNWIHITNHL